MASRTKHKDAEKRGRKAEMLAAMLLRAKGYKIREQRFRSTAGEIDIIAQKGNYIVFVEVKARKTTELALESITSKQQQRIENAACLWLQQQTSQNFAVRFDVITVAPGQLPSHMLDAWRPGW
ncbi:YraN family protein [Kordiimonas aquimaris]|uniref:YraN family protein n=1 Tax=Kordiimonas aquimaris TaxID=707591 RepID=UPI0021D1D495|nr:YraN family protein [Kordiimonas aquimaris]